MIPITSHCTHPKGGTQAKADEIPSVCPPLGLNTCTYSLPCEAIAPPFATTGPTSVCVGKRQGIPCSFTLNGTCTPNAGAGVYDNPPSTAGRCFIRGQDVKPCSASVSSFCATGHYESYTYNCHCVNDCVTENGVTTCSTTCNTCTGQRWECDDTDYTLANGSCSEGFSGNCGVPSGGCSAKPVGGGNLSQEQCEERAATCGGTAPLPPECGPSTPPLGNCKNGTGSTPTLVPGSTNTYQWTCSVGALSTTCTGSTTAPTCDVNVHGAACCPVASGGTCTGQFCATDCATPETCHVKATEDGVCRPSCGTLIIAQGYTAGALPSPNVNGFNDCAHLNAVQHEGSTDWFKVPLIEGKEPWEVIEFGGGECCTRGTPPTCDVNVHGAACCPVSLGGTCTGQFCAINCQTPETCHVKESGGVCRPSCGTLATLRGYGLGADGIHDTPDDERAGVRTGTCADLNTQQLWGSTDWIKIPLIENLEPWEMIENGGGECCGRGPSTTGDCGCTDNGCSEGCDKDTNNDGKWVCKSTDGGTDSGTCEGKCDSSTECCDGDTSTSNSNCGTCRAKKHRTSAQGDINLRVCGTCHADWRKDSPATCTFKRNRWHKAKSNTPKDKKENGEWHSCHTEYNCSYKSESTVCWRHHGKGSACTYHL